MYIKLAAKEIKQLKPHLNGSKKYSVLEATQAIEALEKEALRLEVIEKIIVIVREENKIVLRDELTLGYGDGIHYLVYLENKFKKLSPESGFELAGEKLRIMTRLKELFEQADAESEQSPVLIAGEIQQPDITIIEKLKALLTVKNWRIVAGVLALLFVVSLSVYYAMTPPKTVSQTVNTKVNASSQVTISQESQSIETPDLMTLLEEKRFEEALSLYPQEYPLIERKIFYLGVDGIPYLEDFLKVKDYAKGWFDLAYLKRDYAKVVELKAEADTDERLAQLAVAYALTGAIPEAEALNEQLQVESITQIIFQEKEKQAIQLVKEGKWEEAHLIQSNINSERMKVFFEEIQKTDTAIQSVNEQLAKPGIKEEEKQALEGQKQQLEQHKQQLIDTL